MGDLSLLIHGPTGDCIEVMVLKGEQRRHGRQLAARPLPPSSQARLCRTAGPPFHRHGMRNRVNAMLRTGSCSAASPQLCPRSADTMTFVILPLPE
jgi:hypothetical protein